MPPAFSWTTAARKWRSSVVRRLDAELRGEERRDLSFRFVNRRHNDVGRYFPSQLYDVLAEVCLDRLDSAIGHRRVQVDFLGRHALALHDHARTTLLRDAADDVAGLSRIARPVYLGAGALRIRTELLEVAVEVQQRLVLDGTGAISGTFPIGHARHRLSASLTEQCGSPAQRAPELDVRQRGSRVSVEGLGGENSLRHMRQAVDARTSARCIALTPEPRRDRRPPICMRQLASAETTTSTPAPSIASIF